VKQLGTAVALLVCWFGTGHADEGMWLLNEPPRELLLKKYQFPISDAWLERVQKASIRFNNGGSGSFVSPDGLVVTNHHIGADALQKLSPKGSDFFRDGYYARTRDRELKCPDLELNVLQTIEDVTAQVQAAVKADMNPAQAAAARRAVMARIEKESLAQTGLRSDVVTLYHGGLYHLYRYKRYTDVRLVMAPEHGIAFFGGDSDNFEYPRYNLDICFFRVYENSKPVRADHYFPWSKTGPAEGDLVFVSGHPGTTNRLETVARLAYRRDHFLPYTLQRVRLLEALLLQYSERGADQARAAARDVYRVANARKAYSGMYEGLLDPAIMRQKHDAERSLREPFEVNAEKQQTSPWRRIEEVQKQLADFERLYFLLERGDAFDSRFFHIARHLVRLAEELPKPDGKRLREYRSSALASLKLKLFSPAPIHAGLERVKLAATLSFLVENLGGENPLVIKVLAGKSPAARAEELTRDTKLGDAAQRRRLFDAGKPALDSTADPMIRFALLIDSDARRVRQRFEEAAETERQAYAQIGRALFDKYGKSVPPDATFTLRLAFGVVKGYRVEGHNLPCSTSYRGLYERAEEHRQREPFALPPRWLKYKDRLDLSVPFNFVSTADTIGGNSGSPVLNRKGELVGINFDRNRHGLVRNFVYTDEQARHISVHSRGVLEALRKLYEVAPLVNELMRNGETEK
jgi:hypothetical protein